MAKYAGPTPGPKQTAAVSQAPRTSGADGLTLRKQKDILQSFKIMNGQIQNPIMAPNRYQIMQGANILYNIGVMDQPKTNFKTNTVAEQFLFGVNCTLSNEGADFSLIAISDDDIQEPDSFEFVRIDLKSQQIRIDDKFVNECDPIYNLDEDRPHNVERQAQRSVAQLQPDLIKTSSLMSQMNLTKNPNRLVKYFKNNSNAMKRTKF